MTKIWNDADKSNVGPLKFEIPSTFEIKIKEKLKLTQWMTSSRVNIMAGVTAGSSSRFFLSKHWAYNAVICDHSSCSHTTLLQGFVPWARALKDYSIQNNEINRVPT